MSGPFKMKGSPMKRNFGIEASPAKQKKEGETRKEYRSHTKDVTKKYLGEGASKRDVRKTARKKRKIDRLTTKYEKAQEKRTGDSSYVGESGSKKEARIEKRISKTTKKAKETKEKYRETP